MDAAITERVLEAVAEMESLDLTDVGRVVIDVLLAHGVDRQRVLPTEDIKDLLVTAVRAAQLQPH